MICARLAAARLRSVSRYGNIKTCRAGAGGGAGMEGDTKARESEGIVAIE